AVPMSKDGRYVLTDDALDKPAGPPAKEPPQDEPEKKLPKEAEFRPPPSARGR
ncbi:MAG: hypothetical protein JST92_09415, partial [Deltaproteobacteria bacterium]|nr:hypothetical protein [Deltaproteobacteria bacterium]